MHAVYTLSAMMYVLPEEQCSIRHSPLDAELCFAWLAVLAVEYESLLSASCVGQVMQSSSIQYMSQVQDHQLASCFPCTVVWCVVSHCRLS